MIEIPENLKWIRPPRAAHYLPEKGGKAFSCWIVGDLYYIQPLGGSPQDTGDWMVSIQKADRSISEISAGKLYRGLPRNSEGQPISNGKPLFLNLVNRSKRTQWDTHIQQLPIRQLLNEVLNERKRQDDKFGPANHPDGTGGDLAVKIADSARIQCQSSFENGSGTWKDILLEEVFEAMAESDPKKLREELIQVAAVAVAWVEAIDRRES